MDQGKLCVSLECPSSCSSLLFVPADEHEDDEEDETDGDGDEEDEVCRHDTMLHRDIIDPFF